MRITNIIKLEETTKYRLETAESLETEVVHVKLPGRHIVCFSSMIGCPHNCQFCGARRLIRFLSEDEMKEACTLVAEKEGLFSTTDDVLFSAMGEGEPLVGYWRALYVLAVFRRLHKLIPGARYAVSTIGASKTGLDAFIHWGNDLIAFQRYQITLQVSLHSAFNNVRERLLRVAPIRTTELVSLSKLFLGKVEWNYLVLKGLNDTPADAEALKALLPLGSIVKLNKLNCLAIGKLRALEPLVQGDRGAFRDLLLPTLTPIVYNTNGSEIFAACGQLGSSLNTPRLRT